MLLLSLFLPLYASIIVWFLPYFLGKKKALYYMSSLYIIAFLINLFYLYTGFLKNEIFFYNLGTWLSSNTLSISWGFAFDPLALSMLVMISGVSGAVHFFSIGYMSGDFSIIRFFSLLSLFTFFMFILVASNNFVVLFLGWEGIGVCSFLLISFWNTRIQATKSALKAIIFNRIGDFGYITGICYIFFLFRNLDFDVVFALVPFYSNIFYTSFYGVNFTYIDIICIFLFLGTVGKSAQLGLHLWLPEAMEGPTPVSALIHAATLVTAGIFLVIRCSFIFEYSTLALFIILLIGGITALFGASTALLQNDVKKIIAFSTTSQLGYMAFSCGVSTYNIAFFHLINHAFFKSLLFLAAGSVIHAVSNDQDLRKFGGLIKSLPFTYSLMLIGVLALCGFPFLSGFYSKELIIETSYASYSFSCNLMYWLGTLVACLTSFYSFRCLALVFFGNINMTKFIYQNLNELSTVMGVALSFLALGSIFSGFILKDFFLGLGSTFWNNSLFFFPSLHSSVDCEFIPVSIKNLPLVGSLIGICFALLFNNFIYKKVLLSSISKYLVIDSGTLFFRKVTLILLKIISFFHYKWYFDYIFNNFFGFFLLKHSYNTFYKVIDKGLIEIIFIDFPSTVVKYLAFIFSRQNTGYFYNILCLIFLGIFFITIICFLLL